MLPVHRDVPFTPAMTAAVDAGIDDLARWLNGGAGAARSGMIGQMAGIRARMTAGLASQLARPEGLRGRVVGRMLNRRNNGTVAAAVAATGLEPGQSGADVGFGGGLGLWLLLDAVGPRGTVHGVELSTTMRRAAERRHHAERADGRLVLHPGTIGALPLDDGSVDGLITTNTLYFVEDVAAAFTEVARVLAPAGRAVIGVGDPAAMASIPVTQHGFRLRPVPELVAGLGKAGMDVVRHERVGDEADGFHLLVAQHATEEADARSARRRSV